MGKERSNLAKPLKSIVNGIGDKIPIFSVVRQLTGSNESRQYNAELNYQSKITGIKEKILFEIGLREEHLLPPKLHNSNTLLINQFTMQPVVSPYAVKGFSLEEAYAEKMRAALTRQKPAIRDFFDISYALQNNIIDIENNFFIDLVKRKLEVPATKFSLDSHKIKLLRSKIDSELLPTLRKKDGGAFDLDDIINRLTQYYEKHILSPVTL